MPEIEGYIGNCHPENSTADRGVSRGQQWNSRDADTASTSCNQVSIPSWANGISLVYELLIQCLLLSKISQAEKVGQMQHPEYALKSASLVEPMV